MPWYVEKTDTVEAGSLSGKKEITWMSRRY